LAEAKSKGIVDVNAQADTVLEEVKVAALSSTRSKTL